MEYPVYALFALLPILIGMQYASRKRQKKIALKRHLLIKKDKHREAKIMLELIKTLIGKNCAIHTIDNDYEGLIERVEDGWIVIKDRWFQNTVLVNPEYVIGIRECKEKKKKAKKVEELEPPCEE